MYSPPATDLESPGVGTPCVGAECCHVSHGEGAGSGSRDAMGTQSLGTLSKGDACRLIGA
jgi:hypothetical protein